MRRRSTALFFISILVLSSVTPLAPWFVQAHAAAEAAKTVSEKVKPLTVNEPKGEPNVTSGVSAQDVPKMDGTLDNPSGKFNKSNKSRERSYEDTSLRTATTKTWVNTDGTRTMEYSVAPKHYQKNGKWEDLNQRTIKDKAYRSNKSLDNESLLKRINPLADDTQAFTSTTGNLMTKLRPFADGLEVNFEGKTFTVIPVGSSNVRPVVKNVDGVELITYVEAWPGVDVTYEIVGASLKETIILKRPGTQNSYVFQLKGATVSANPLAAKDKTLEGSLAIDGLNPEEFYIAPVTIATVGSGTISEPIAKQVTQGKTIAVVVDPEWLQKQPASVYPIEIDPIYTNNVGGTYGNFYGFKSDGYSCNNSNCNPRAGSLFDVSATWKTWRSLYKIPTESLAGKTIINANLHMVRRNGSTAGTTDGRWFGTSWGSQWGYNCTHGPSQSGGYVWTDNWVNVTETIKWMAANAPGGWMCLWGEEGAISSYKDFEPNYFTMDVDYDTPTPMTSPLEPADKQVVTTAQPSLSVNPVTDADAGETTKYYFRVSTSTNAESGAIINSGWINGTKWTLPEGVLQDGTTYYWHTYTQGRAGYLTTPTWVKSFKVDLRTGKDSTQAYDTAGPVSVDMATGNVTTGNSTHNISALGGSIGASMEYNSPVRTLNGLKAQYWNTGANYPGGVPGGNPAITRTDANVDFAWGTGSPDSAVTSDDFYGRWTGYFVAPVTGSYTFGASNDDVMNVMINGTSVYLTNICGNICYGTSVSLTAGQIVPFETRLIEHTGYATARVFVKGAVTEQIVPQAWLRTDPKPVSQSTGLMGSYFTDDGSHNFPTNESDPTRLILSRNDPVINFNWGDGGPVVGGTINDNFMVRWRGYISVPVAASYTFGAFADDGIRITIAKPDGSTFAAMDRWQDQSGTYWGTSSIALDANRFYPITIDYFEHGGGAAMNLLIRQAGQPDREVPANWMVPRAPVLPAGWQLGVDADGNVGYERIRANASSATLYDSSGDAHEYLYANGVFTPPVNEDGKLVRNVDGTHALTDVDGRVYQFDVQGQLTSVVTPQDDKNPTALQYTYGGNPSRLIKIADGVDPSRYGTVHYSGDAECVTPANFDPAPVGMMCAFKTTDGEKTNLYYKNYRLARVEKPGSEITDYGYTSATCSGCITSIRDGIAADAVAAGIRADDATVNSEFAYDVLGRVSAITLPAATAGATRQQKTYEYVPGGVDVYWTTPEVMQGETPTGSPVLVHWGNGKQAVFARFGTNELRYQFYENGNWSGWQSLGTCMLDDPAAASWGDGRIDVFIRGCDNNLYTRYYSNGAWSGTVASPFSLISGTAITSSPSATSWAENRYDVVARGPSNELMHRWYSPSSGWSSFGSQGGCLSQAPTVSTWGVDRLNIYVQGCGSPTSFFSKYWAAGWTDFAVLTGEQNITSAPQSISSPDKKIQVVTRGSAGNLRYLQYNGSSWEPWSTVQPCITGSPAITQVTDVTTLMYKGCDGKLYQTKKVPLGGTTKMHISGSSEPNGYDQKVDYDNLYRTVKNTDKTGLSTVTEWDPIKDLQYSATDATGLRSTSIYDYQDRVTDSYGAAPKEWFGADRKPLPAYVNQVPHTQSNFDEGIQGLSIAVYNNKKLLGAPKVHATAFSASPAASHAIDLPSSSVPPTDGLSYRATGRIKLNEAGTHSFRLNHSDGARVYIDNQLLIDDWTDGTERFSPSKTYANKYPGQWVQIRIDVYKTGTTGRVFAQLYRTAPGGSEQTDLASLLTPDYSLTTSSKVFDTQTGDVSNKTNFGAQPELGQTNSVIENYVSGGTAADQNLTTSFTYEPYQAGSLMRQTSKTLPGGNTFTYQYYGATEARANPCVAGSPAVSQAGMSKGKSEPDPDNNAATNDQPGVNAPRTSESVYDAAGRVVATRYNSDPWTCTTYDARDRVLTTTIPEVTLNGETRAARTIHNEYIVYGSPLVTTTWDENGWIVVWTDLLGRVTKYRDVRDNETTSTYDDQGHLINRTSPLGYEEFTYDAYDRLVDQKLDGTTYSHITYDAFSRIDNVTYPAAGQQKVTYARDNLGRMNALSYLKGDGTAGPSDSVTRSVTGDILSGTENGIAKSYAYDNAGRLTSATLGANTYSYNYAAPTSGQCAQPSANLNTHKNSNRTSMTVNGATTTYCYNYADQLISSSDPLVNGGDYDAHGNMTSLGSTSTPLRFAYDSSDRNTGIVQRDNTGNGFAVYYTRDVQGRITYREKDTITDWNWNVTNQSYYGFTGSGDTPDFVKNASGTVTEKYLQLPGNVILTIRPGEQDTNAQKTYSLPNIHSDIFATTNASGTVLSTHTTGPFGETISGQTTPNNATSGTTYQYVGQHEKLSESDFTVSLIQMGARVYIPILGRFLQVDPVEGGTDNSYVYVVDGVNELDLDGNVAVLALAGAALYVGGLAWAAYDVAKHPTPVNIAVLAVSVIPGAGIVKVATKGRAIARITSNAAKGARGEKLVAGILRLNPFYKVETLRRATGVQTGKGARGMRYSDILVTNRITGKIKRFEVKTGKAIYSAAQRAKDRAIENMKGQKTFCIRIGWNYRC